MSISSGQTLYKDELTLSNRRIEDKRGLMNDKNKCSLSRDSMADDWIVNNEIRSSEKNCFGKERDCRAMYWIFSIHVHGCLIRAM